MELFDFKIPTGDTVKIGKFADCLEDFCISEGLRGTLKCTVIISEVLDGEWKSTTGRRYLTIITLMTIYLFRYNMWEELG